MKSIQQRILTVIHERGLVDSAAIRAALPDCTRHQINSGLFYLRQGGMAAADESKPARYSFIRWPIERPELTKEARRAAQREYSRRNRAKKSPEELERLREQARQRDRAYRARKGGRTRAQWLAELRANAKPKPAPKKPRPSVIRSAREQPSIVRAFVPKTAPTPKPAMSSDDFIRQGGKFERIPAVWERAA